MNIPRQPDEAWESRFRWVQLNRTRPQRGSSLREALGRWIKGELEARHGASTIWAEAIDGVVDDVFRRHCRVASQEPSALCIMVDAPSLVDPMRRQWSGVIRGALSAVGGKARKLRIQFVYEPRPAQTPANAC